MSKLGNFDQISIEEDDTSKKKIDSVIDGLINEDTQEEEKEKEIEKVKTPAKKPKEITQEYINEVIKNFLRHYKKKRLMRVKKTNEQIEMDIDFYIYRIKDILNKENPFLIVNFKDILEYKEKQVIDKESVSHLIYLLTNEPYKVRILFEENVRTLYKEAFADRFDMDAKVQALHDHIQVGFTQFQDKPTQLHELRAHYLSKFITVEGVISQFDDKVLVKTLQSVWTCDDCNRSYTNKGAKPPAKCLNKDCTSRSFTQDLQRSVKQDYLDVRLTQQYNGLQKTNTVDRYVRINGTALVNHVLNNISPGQIAVIHGVVVLSELINPKDNNSGSDIEIDAFHVEQKNNVNIFDYDERLLNLVKDPINEKNINAHVDKMRRSICSHLYKQEAMKEAVLLQMVGTNPRRREDGTRRKGDINILNLGNSGLGKSDYIVYICLVMPHSIVAGTEGSTSVAGLTTFIETNPKTGKKAVSLGVLALTDMKGIACIEEINRRNAKALNEFANATDDNQKILVNKGGFHAGIYSRCPIYATANSLDEGGIWDDNKTISEQTKLDAFLLQRMDLVFVTRGEKSKDYKEKLMAHLEKEEHNTVFEKDFLETEEGRNQIERTEEVLKEVEIKLRNNDFTGVYPIEYMRHEIYYLKTIDCKLLPNSEAYNILKKFWIEFSSATGISPIVLQDNVTKELESDVMDVRKWSTLQKLSEAYGRMYRCNEVQPEHAKMACNLLALAIASTIPQIDLSDEKANEYAKKLLDKAAANKIVGGLTKEKAQQKAKTFNKFKTELTRYNNILFKVGYRFCEYCKGVGKIAEIIDSERNKTETHDCLECKGEGGREIGFSYLDFEASVVENGIMNHERCQAYWDVYTRKQIVVLEDNFYYLNVDLKSPDTIDAIIAIAENFTEKYMERLEEIEQQKLMNNKRIVTQTKMKLASDY